MLKTLFLHEANRVLFRYGKCAIGRVLIKWRNMLNNEVSIRNGG